VNSRRALYAQAIRGPVLLVTIGILFAVQQAGMLPLSRTWPLLIIIVGLLKLVERLAMPRAPYPPPGGQAQ